jgi:hypothetical protein
MQPGVLYELEEKQPRKDTLQSPLSGQTVIGNDRGGGYVTLNIQTYMYCVPGYI